MRYRKNINCLSGDELHDLREALAGMFALPASDANSFARIAGFHGGPPTAYCAHGAPGFFTWHRAYLIAFESALRSISCDVTLPYWDWSSGATTGVPAACREATYVNRSGATVPNPLFRGPSPFSGQTSRRANIDSTSFATHAQQTQAALALNDFNAFQSSINGVHGSVHVTVGGDMGSVPTAGFDPIFYLHHANIDRLWAMWQTSHPGSLPPTEAAFELQPFNRPFSTEWQRGSDVESVTALGYQYLRFCFFFPPIRLWELIRVRLPLQVREQMASARLAIRATSMPENPVEIRAFVNSENATGRTKTEGNNSFAGAVGLMGHGARSVAACPECGAKLEPAHSHEPGHDHGHDDSSPTVCPECGTRLAAIHDHAMQPIEVGLNLTGAVRASTIDEEELLLALVAVDDSGNDVVDANDLIGSIELVVD